MVKIEKITIRNTFCPDKRLCFLAGKSHPALLQGWLWDTGYPICYNLPLFATVCHYSRLFATIRTIRDYSHYSYSSLFIIQDYLTFTFLRLFAIRYSDFPDTPASGDNRVATWWLWWHCCLLELNNDFVSKNQFFPINFFSYFFHKVSMWSIWKLREILFFKIANLTLWYQTFAKNTIFNHLVRFFGCHDAK